MQPFLNGRATKEWKWQGAGLLLSSFRQLMQADLGFRSEGLLMASATPPRARYPQLSDLRSFQSRALEAIRELPQVSAAAVIDRLPFSDSSDYVITTLYGEGQQITPGEPDFTPVRLVASAGLFEIMKIGLVSGRFFTAEDSENGPDVIIVDERVAKRLWPGRDATGMRAHFAGAGPDPLKVDDKTKWMRVVGVVKTARMEDLAGKLSTGGTYYVPYVQVPAKRCSFVVRTNGDPAGAVKALRGAIARIDPELAVADIRTFDQRAEASLAPQRAAMNLAIAFSVLALFLAAVGIYGVLAYLVAARGREVGIRLALGCPASGIVTLVLREGLILTGIGMALGICGAFGLQRVIENEVYGVRTLDPLVMASVGLLLVAATVVASVEPAWRATRVAPASVLRG